MSQTVADQQPVTDKMSLRDIFDTLKKAPDGRGINALGYDGVLRRFDEERNVVDAVGLNPVQIREYYENFPLPKRFLAADGRNISREDMFNPAAENIPKKPTEEDIAKMKARVEELERHGVTCSIQAKSADDSEPSKSL